MEAAHKGLILWRITINLDVNSHLKINFEMSGVVKFDYSKSCKMHFFVQKTLHFFIKIVVIKIIFFQTFLFV